MPTFTLNLYLSADAELQKKKSKAIANQSSKVAKTSLKINEFSR